jgi:hypothetical protein
MTLSRPLARRVAAIPAPAETPITAPVIPERVIQAAVDALVRGETHYTDRPGILPLRSLVSERLKADYGVEISPKDITITCGATEARFVALKVLAKPGTRIVCPGSQDRISGAAHLIEAEIVPRVGAPRAVSVLYLTPDDDQHIVDELLGRVMAHGWWVIWDMEAPGHRAVFHPGQHPELLPRITTIDGLAEQMPGWRVGWLAGSEMAERLRAFKQSMTICTTSVSQWAAVEMMKP